MTTGQFGENFGEFLFGQANTITGAETSPLTVTPTNALIAPADVVTSQANPSQVTPDNKITAGAVITTAETQTILPILRGVRRLPSHDLTAVGIIEDSAIRWQSSNTTSNQRIIIEVSTDGGNTWQSVSNGGSIPQLNNGDVVLGTTLDVRQVLETDDSSQTPSLDYHEVVVRSQLGA